MPNTDPRNIWQAEALKAITSHFKTSARGYVSAATGSGKTRLQPQAHEALGSRLTLVLVPSIALLEQTANVWVDVCAPDFEAIAVCSDGKVLVDGRDMNERVGDHDIGHVVTTDPKAIASFMRASVKGCPKVVFATYQSQPSIVLAQRLKNVPDFDLMILDEVHRTATGGHAGRGLFKTGLLDKNIRASKRLGMTATPKVYSSAVQDKASSVGYEVASMDNQELYGQCIFDYPFKKAVEDGVLREARLVIVGVKKSEVQELIDQRAFVNNKGEAVDAETVAKHVALIKALANYGLEKVIGFVGRIKDAKMFADKTSPFSLWRCAEAMGLGEDIHINHISGNMRMTKRRQKLVSLQATKNPHVLWNARCLTEGIDVPALDAIFLHIPKGSEVDVRQAVGRVVRLHPNGKKYGYIILPVFVNDNQDIDKQIEKSEFANVITAIISLAEQDQTKLHDISSFITSLSNKPQSSKVKEFLDNFMDVLDIPDGHTLDMIQENIYAKLVSNLPDDVVITATFQAYKAEHGVETLVAYAKQMQKVLDPMPKRVIEMVLAEDGIDAKEIWA